MSDALTADGGGASNRHGTRPVATGAKANATDQPAPVAPSDLLTALDRAAREWAHRREVLGAARHGGFEARIWGEAIIDEEHARKRYEEALEAVRADNAELLEAMQDTLKWINDFAGPALLWAEGSERMADKLHALLAVRAAMAEEAKP